MTKIENCPLLRKERNLDSRPPALGPLLFTNFWLLSFYLSAVQSMHNTRPVGTGHR
jgi:hypothetical protein